MNKKLGILAILLIAIAIPATVLISLNQQNLQQNAAGTNTGTVQSLTIPTVSPAPAGCHYKVICPSRCPQNQCVCSNIQVCPKVKITL